MQSIAAGFPSVARDAERWGRKKPSGQQRGFIRRLQVTRHRARPAVAIAELVEELNVRPWPNHSAAYQAWTLPANPLAEDPRTNVRGAIFCRYTSTTARW